MDTRGYEKNRRIPAQWIPDGYGYEYGANIYLAGRVRGSYYSYPTCPVDIPTRTRPIYKWVLKYQLPADNKYLRVVTIRHEFYPRISAGASIFAIPT